MLRFLLFAFLFFPVASRAEGVAVTYAAYAAGLNVINLRADFDIVPSRYHIRLAYKTAGTFGLFVHAEQDTTVEGAFADQTARPVRFRSSGVLRGEPRLTAIDYREGRPEIRELMPPNAQEREKVSPELQQGTIDSLSAMAELVRKVNQTHRCDGRATMFDGRRLAELSARTVGEEFLPPTHLSTFSGNALHCEFEGRQLGGFMLDEDRERLQRPQHGGAWFAAVTPGGPLIPVRISFRTRWFGDANMFVTSGVR